MEKNKIKHSRQTYAHKNQEKKRQGPPAQDRRPRFAGDFPTLFPFFRGSALFSFLCHKMLGKIAGLNGTVF